MSFSAFSQLTVKSQNLDPYEPMERFKDSYNGKMIIEENNHGLRTINITIIENGKQVFNKTYNIIFDGYAQLYNNKRWQVYDPKTNQLAFDLYYINQGKHKLSYTYSNSELPNYIQFVGNITLISN